MCRGLVFPSLAPGARVHRAPPCWRGYGLGDDVAPAIPHDDEDMGEAFLQTFVEDESAVLLIEPFPLLISSAAARALTSSVFNAEEQCLAQQEKCTAER